MKPTQHNTTQHNTTLKLLLAFIIMIGFSFNGLGQTPTNIYDNTPNGPITGNHVITQSIIWSDPLYHIYDDVVVLSGATLTIAQGVQLVFFNDLNTGSDDKGNPSKTGIFIEKGALIANGTQNQQITMTANNTTSGWEGVNFSPGLNVTTILNNYHSSITYCIIEYVNKPLTGNCPAEATTSGAIYLNNFNNINIENSIICDNTVSFIGGGIVITEYGNALNVYNLLQNYPIIANNEISNNTAKRGAAICLLFSENQTPQIYNNDIHDNIATHDGSGIAVLKKANSYIFNNQIHHNTTNCQGNSTTPSFSGGGGILVGFNSYADIIGNDIFENTVLYNPNATDLTGVGGGIFIRLSSTANLENNSIHNNNAQYGGGIAVYATKPSWFNNIGTPPSYITAFDNEIYDNTSNDLGGGVLIDHSSADMRYNEIYSNNAQVMGGGIHINASTINATSTNKTIEIYNNIISYNTSNTGAGLYANGDNSNPLSYCTNINVINNLIHSNNCQTNGAGVFFGSGFMDIKFNNNTVSKNFSDTDPNGNAIYIPNRLDDTKYSFINNILYYNDNLNDCQIFYPNNYDGEFINNDIMMLGCQIDPINNIDIIPEFVDLAYNNFQLASYSPLIDLGLNTVTPVANDDIIHSPRFIGNIDIGAYEYNGTSPRLSKHIIEKVSIFPNPASDKVQIESPENIFSIHIYSLDGKKVFTKHNIDNTYLEIDISMLNKGVYLIEINSNNHIENQKLIKL